MGSLTAKQVEWMMREKAKDADFLIGKKINYQPSVHEFIIDKAMNGLSDYEIAKVMQIKPQVIYNWVKIYPQLKSDLDSVRKCQLEKAHQENAFGQQITREVTTKKDREGNVTQTIEVEKQHAINTTSLDRLAQKYAPELAPKEIKDIDIDIKVRVIDFSKLEKAISVYDIIDVESRDVESRDVEQPLSDGVKELI
jgi:hypothetical protein